MSFLVLRLALRNLKRNRIFALVNASGRRALYACLCSAGDAWDRSACCGTEPGGCAEGGMSLLWLVLL